MTAAIGKYAARKMLNGQLKKYKKKDPVGPKDPYYEFRTNPRTGKMKKYKKQIPAYIPEHDANILATVRKNAYRLDCALFSLFGMRFGWESVIGLVPGVGDMIGVFLAYQLMQKASEIDGGLPSSVKSSMMMWILIDFVVGLVPFVGDLLDASIKCNTINCRLLEEHLDKKYKPKGHVPQQGVVGDEPYAPATVYEDMSDEDLPQYSTQPPSRHATIARPAAAVAPEDRRGNEAPKRQSGRGLFGGKSSRQAAAAV